MMYWFSILIVIIWVAFGYFFLYRKKLELLKKYGNSKTNDELIAISKTDPEAKKLLIKSRIYIAAGIFIFCAIQIGK